MKKYLLTISLFTLLVIISIASLFIGVININLGNLFTGETEALVMVVSRIPRLMAILCTGSGLAVSGLIMQKLCSNKFVSPSTGATISGAQLGIMISLLLIPNASVISRSVFAFGVSLIATLIFVFFIIKIKFKDPIMVPLIGIMLSNIITGITNFVAYKFEATQIITSYFNGSFAGVLAGRYEIVYLVVPLLIIAFIFANHFNIVGMGKEFSKNLGINYNLLLIIGLCICAMITASIVSVVGSISYIGLIIPNIVVMFKGDKIKGTMVDTAILGALFVLICDIIGRVVIFPYELPINLIAGIIGSIFFILLIIYRMKYGNKAVALKQKNKEVINYDL